jgi:hypothetical protein
MLKSKLAIAAIAALCIAVPARAQSFSPETGSGNVVAGNGGQTTAPAGHVAAHRSGLHAYALVPRQPATGAANGALGDPAITGGGSAGYNESLTKY